MIQHYYDESNGSIEQDTMWTHGMMVGLPGPLRGQVGFGYGEVRWSYDRKHGKVYRVISHRGVRSGSGLELGQIN